MSIKLSKLRHYFHDLSIFKKTFYGISLIIIFISLFSLIFSYSYTSDIFVERVLDNVGVLVKSLNRNMENDINQIDRIITSIYAESKKVNSDQLIMREIISTKSYESLEEQYWAVQAANDFFQQMLYLREDFSNVYIYVSPEKTFSYTLSGKSRMEYDPTDDDWYKRTVEADGETLIFPPHLPFQIDDVNEVVSFAKLLKNIDDIRGEPYGVILIDISLKRLRQAVGDYAMDSQTKVLFLDENDQPIYSQNIDVDEEMFDTSVYPYIRDKNDGSFITTVSQNKYLAAFQTSEISGWKLLILTPSSRILEESRGILITFSVLSLTAILLALTLAFVFSKVLYRPIRAILSGIDQVNKGDFHSFVDFESKDELGMLVKSFNEMVYRTRKMVLERYEEKLARNNAEFKYLQAQINPHFIYNSLQIINSIALVHKIPDLQAVSRDLAKIMRYSIPSDESLVSLKKEIDNVEAYLEIQKIRFKEYLTYELDIPSEFHDCKIVKLALQPIVENSIVHGLKMTEVGGIIKITAHAENDLLLLEIWDNGLGFDVPALVDYLQGSELAELRKEHDLDPANRNHVGLRNIHLRLKLIFGEKFGLELASKKGEWSSVRIKIPFRVSGNRCGGPENDKNSDR